MILIPGVKRNDKLDELADPVKCPNKFCNRKFGGSKRKYNLKNHLINECGVTLKCTVCSKEFGHLKSVRYHMGVAHHIFL